MNKKQIDQLRRSPMRYVHCRAADFVRAEVVPGLDAKEDDIVMNGYAVKWDDVYETPWFTESFAKGAFDGKMHDVRFLIQHEGLALARQTAGTLRAVEDNVGLRFSVALDPGDMDAQTLAAKVERGAVNGVSVGFTMRPDGEEHSQQQGEDKPVHYTIQKVGELMEFSAVTFPAYAQTEIELMRSMFPGVTFPAYAQTEIELMRSMFPGARPAACDNDDVAAICGEPTKTVKSDEPMASKNRDYRAEAIAKLEEAVNAEREEDAKTLEGESDALMERHKNRQARLAKLDRLMADRACEDNPRRERLRAKLKRFAQEEQDAS